jgi:hypothetical protein
LCAIQSLIGQARSRNETSSKLHTKKIIREATL